MTKTPPEGSTYYDRTVADEWLLRQGRFADEVAAAKVPAVPQYPAQPVGSFWAGDPVPTEPALGYRIDQMTEGNDEQQTTPADTASPSP